VRLPPDGCRRTIQGSLSTGIRDSVRGVHSTKWSMYVEVDLPSPILLGAVIDHL